MSGWLVESGLVRWIRNSHFDGQVIFEQSSRKRANSSVFLVHCTVGEQKRERVRDMGKMLDMVPRMLCCRGSLVLKFYLFLELFLPKNRNLQPKLSQSKNGTGRKKLFQV